MAVIQVKYDQNGKAKKAWEVMDDGTLKQFYPRDDVDTLLQDMKIAFTKFRELNTKRINAIREENIKEYLSDKFNIFNQGDLDKTTRELLALVGIEGYGREDA